MQKRNKNDATKEIEKNYKLTLARNTLIAYLYAYVKNTRVRVKLEREEY